MKVNKEIEGKMENILRGIKRFSPRLLGGPKKKERL